MTPAIGGVIGRRFSRTCLVRADQNTEYDAVVTTSSAAVFAVTLTHRARTAVADDGGYNDDDRTTVSFQTAHLASGYVFLLHSGLILMKIS